MPDRRVASRTRDSFCPAVNVGCVNGLGDVLVAAAAGGFRHLAVETGYLDCVGIIAECEIKRMKETIAGLDRIFSNNAVRRMAVITGGSGMMTGFDPAVVLGAHHVTVGAGRGIIQKIRISFGVQKSVAAHANRHADRDAEYQAQPFRPHNLSLNKAAYYESRYSNFLGKSDETVTFASCA